MILSNRGYRRKVASEAARDGKEDAGGLRDGDSKFTRIVLSILRAGSWSDDKESDDYVERYIIDMARILCNCQHSRWDRHVKQCQTTLELLTASHF